MTASKARAHDLLGPALLELSAAVREAARRVATTGASAADEEAVHDFRVALRRLRTLLRPARAVYGKKRLDPIAAELRRFARTSGALRDEEVLRETIGALQVAPFVRRGLDAWARLRARRERSLRRALALLVGAHGDPAGEGAPPSLGDTLDALAATIAHLKRHRSAEKLGHEALRKALAGVDRARAEAPDVRDAAAMHALRIRYKRLRYTAEIFAPVLGEDAAHLAREAARMQKRLGELHDLDEAMGSVGRARSLAHRVRAGALAALQKARAELAERIRAELAPMT